MSALGANMWKEWGGGEAKAGNCPLSASAKTEDANHSTVLLLPLLNQFTMLKKNIFMTNSDFFVLELVNYEKQHISSH